MDENSRTGIPMPFEVDLDDGRTYKNSVRRMSSSDRWTKTIKYVKRIFKYKQMDYQFALWQIIYLFISPQKVFRDFQYRKRSKDQYARDDPAFFILLLGMICVSSIALAFTLKMGILGCIKFIAWSTLFDCLFIGSIIATLFWFISNHYMTDPRNKDLDVEWAYAFDVHLNAMFPLILILHGIQLPFIPTIVNHYDNHLFTAFGNVFWLIAITYYIYISFIGYSSLPNITKSHLILTPLSVIFVLFFLSIGFNLNLTNHFVLFHKYRSL